MVKTENANDVLIALVTGYYSLIELFDLSEECIAIDLEKANEVIERYWRDADRLKRFHKIESIDCHKIAGYLTYWICKIKPLQTNNTYGVESNAIREANELLALIVAVGRINCSEMYLAKGKEVLLRREFLEAFLYTLKYRPLNGDLLSIIYYFIDKFR